ncbi:VanZ like family protein [compost metagenome]
MAPISTKRFYILLFAAIGWMVFIFYKSAESYQEQSLKPFLNDMLSTAEITKWIPHWEFSYMGSLVSWKDPQGLLEFFVRKGAHIFEYLVLSMLWTYGLLAKQWKLNMALLTSSLISILYAASDEWHQTWVPGRTGHAIDVGVDAIGVLLMLIWFLLIRRLIGRLQK